ncbi:MAG: hypothetical protein WC389_02520 [Lutibacter sp.]
MKKQFLYPFVTVTLLVSCTKENIDTLSYPNTNTDLTNVTYTANVKTVIDNNCLGCHGAVNPTAGFDISTYDKAKNNINSIISRVDLQTGQSGVMPTSGRMSESNIQILKNWKTQGLLQ